MQLLETRFPLEENLCDILRRETKVLHQKIEQLPIMQGITNGSINLLGYFDLLNRFLNFYRPMEKNIGLFYQHCSPAYQYTYKAPLLNNDIAYLKKIVCNEKEITPKKLHLLPSIFQMEDFLGVLYVIEGSTLGGKMIRQMLVSHLGDMVNQAVSFFDPYNKNCRNHWLITANFINEYAINNHINVQRSICAASDVFISLSDSLAADWEE